MSDQQEIVTKKKENQTQNRQQKSFTLLLSNRKTEWNLQNLSSS